MEVPNITPIAPEEAKPVAPVAPAANPETPAEQPAAAPLDPKVEDLARSIVSEMLKKQEEEKLAEYMKTIDYTKTKIVEESGLKPEYSQSLGEEIDNYIKYNPTATQDQVEHFATYIKSRVASEAAEIDRLKDAKHMYREAVINRNYGAKGIEVETAMRRVFANTTGLTDDAVSAYFESMPHDVYTKTLDNFYSTKWLKSGGELEKMGFNPTEEPKVDPAVEALKTTFPQLGKAKK